MSEDTSRNDLGSVTGQAIRAALMQLESCTPAKVTKIDRNKNRVSVLPMIQMGTEDGEKISRAVVHNIPVLTMGGGGFFMSYPVKVGDLGLLFSADRDTSLFYQSNGGEDWPNTERLFSFSDGGFLPLNLFSFTIAGGVEDDGVSLQSEDGNVFFTMKNGEICLKADTIKIVGKLKHEGDTEYSGSITASGDISANGNVTGSEVTVGALALSTHVHTCAAPGTPASGPIGPPPIP